ncbi:MAG: hypothetical protein NTW03_05620 [Verrucomicrobia bacterium]|nr:hypothetical protein [Verrucomicrobiota bacterium]
MYSFSTLHNCAIFGNSALFGGGALYSTLHNCAIFGNTAAYSGGGVDGGSLNNCTVTGNSVTATDGPSDGGGAYSATLNNCIVYYNYNTTTNIGPNYSNCTFNYCCTTPDPGSGTGNITAEPLLASTSHLSATSPCRGAGSAAYSDAYSTGLDIDGEPWLNPPSIGCDEYQVGASTGDITVAIGASQSYVKVGLVVNFTGINSGGVSASMWDLGDGIVLSNQPCASRSWDAPGVYTVLFRAYNDSHPQGVNATIRITVVTHPTHYVLPTSSNPQPPYHSWETAARTIQDAVDIAIAGDHILVTNGVYATGGRVGSFLTNRVAVTKPLLIQSVNGPAVTVIQGYQVPGTTNGDGAIRCVYLSDGAVLSGFMLTQGATHIAQSPYVNDGSGGGAWCDSTNALLTNCTIAANAALRLGGGVCFGTLINCALLGNWAPTAGGGAAAYATLINCTLNGNSARYGGGAYGGTLNNCTITGNSAAAGGGGALGGTLNNCILCFNTAPSGSNCFSSSTLNSCFTEAPFFVDRLNGNLRLQSNSPCINAGNNAYVSTSTDLDGRPRIVGGSVDIGAYEFQPTVPGAFIAWLQGYGLPTDGSADLGDPDHDNLNNLQEWTADTNPTDATSWLRVESISPGPPVAVSLQTSAARLYTLQSCTDMANPQWLAVPTATDIPGTGGPLILTDSTPAATAPRFYRVSVRLP